MTLQNLLRIHDFIKKGQRAIIVDICGDSPKFEIRYGLYINMINKDKDILVQMSFFLYKILLNRNIIPIIAALYTDGEKPTNRV